MNPDELLAQIMDLCGQYIQAGGDPNQVMEAVGQAAQGGGGGMPPPTEETGEMPPGGGGMPPSGGMRDQMPMMSGDTGMPDMTGGMPLDQQQSGGYGSFEDANAALQGDMLKKIKGR